MNTIVGNVTRTPSGAGEITADVVRALGLVSTAVAAVALGLTNFAMFALILFGLSLARAMRLRPALDVAFCASLLVAGWSSTLDLYTTVPGWDLLIHFVANGVIAAVAYILYATATPAGRAMTGGGQTSGSKTGGGIAGGNAVLLTTSFGLALAAIWEMAEWAGHTFIDSTIFVDYVDTIGDMAAGGLGAVLAGALMRYLVRTDTSVEPERDARGIHHQSVRSTSAPSDARPTT